MLNNVWKKGIVVGIIVLFVGASVVPNFGSYNAIIKKQTTSEYKVGLHNHANGVSSHYIARTYNDCILNIKDGFGNPIFTINKSWSNWDVITLIGDMNVNYNYSTGIYFSGDSNTGAMYEAVSYDTIPSETLNYSVEMKVQFLSGWGTNGLIFNYIDEDNYGYAKLIWERTGYGGIYCGIIVDGVSYSFYEVRDLSPTEYILKVLLNNYNHTAIIYVDDEFVMQVDIPIPIVEVYVDDDFNASTPGWGYDHFDSIQNGVDAVEENGTVYVYNGTYNESWLFPECSYIYIDKSINLIGENKDTAIVNCPDSGQSGGQFGIRIGFSGTISVSDVLISGFTISGGDDPESIGIYLQRDSNNITIEDCRVHNFADGMEFVNGSRNIAIKNCITYNNRRRGGISFAWHDVSDFEIIRCTSYSNSYGINIAVASNGLIYHNNLFNNSFNAVDESGNIWNKSYPYGGNYWDDYPYNDSYSGPNQDIPGPDGIGDIPYEIPCEHGIDYYPLMNPFEQYYMLYISAPPEVNEGELFNVVVTSMGGPVVPDVAVGFNDELKLTDADGRVYFTAPLVGEDTYYEITATKDGYTGYSEMILIKNIPDESETSIIVGRIINLTTGDVITFNAVNILVIKFSIPPIQTYKSGELITIKRDYFGIVTPRFIFALCDVYIE